MSIAEHNNVTELAGQNLNALVARQRSQFRAEGEVTYATRIDRLKRLKALILRIKRRLQKQPNVNLVVLDPMNSVCSQNSRQRSKPSTIR